jgi:hypothetical protein
MKKRVLLLTLLSSSLGFSQSLTQANEPAIGASISMFVCDSSYANFDSTNGNNVTWNFSGISGYSGVPSKNVSVEAPVNSDYAPATKVMVIDGFVSTFWTSSAVDRTSQGFLYTDATVGDVEVKFATDNEKMCDYPFALSNTFTDSYSGTLYNATMTPMGATSCSGTCTAAIDGKGTLILPGAISIADVIRYKIIETTTSTITIFGSTIEITIVRTQFDYHNVNNSSLPIFSHISLDVFQNGNLFNTTNLVLSSVEPSVLVGVKEGDRSDFVAYPNPAQGQITLKGEFGVGTSAQVLDQTGRVAVSVNGIDNGTILDISGLKKGIYFLSVVNKGEKTMKTIEVY